MLTIATAARWGRMDRLRRHADLVVLAVFPLVLLAFNRSWTFLTPAAQIDPYIYTGFFLDFPHLLEVAPPTYYAARIPWLLLGGGLYNLFGPDAGNIALRLLLFWSGTGFLYGVVRLLFDSRWGALTAAVALGVNPLFLAAVAWDYPNGPAIAMLLLTSLGLALAWRRDRRWLVLAGCAALTAASVQLVTVPLLAAILLPFAVLTRWVRPWVWFALGAAAALLVYGCANLLLTGTFSYWQLQLEAARADQGNQRREYLSWIRYAHWLVPHVIGLGAAIGLAARRTPVAIAAAASLLLASLAFVYFQFGDMSKANVLALDYYAVMLTPLTYVAIGGALSHASPRAALAACVVLMVPFVLGWMQAYPNIPCCDYAGPAVLRPILAAVLVALAAARPRFVLAAVMALTINYAAGRPFAYFPPLEQKRIEARMILDTVQALRPYNEDGGLAFWYNLEQPLGAVYRGISSSNRWSAVSEAFPKLIGPYSGEPSRLYQGQTVALLTTDPADLDVALQSVEASSLTPQEIARFTMREMYVYVLKMDAYGQVRVQTAADEWPEAFHLVSRGRPAQEYRASAPNMHVLARFDKAMPDELKSYHYGFDGGLGPGSGCLRAKDSCGRFQAGTPQDHAVTAFLDTRGGDDALVFFTAWLKPLSGSPPSLTLQDDGFRPLAVASPVATRPDGWTLHAGVWRPLAPAKVRLLIMQPAGAEALIDKLLLVEGYEDQ